MNAYTTSKYANYAHIHMYVLSNAFRKRIGEMHLDESDFDFDANIDGNVVSWQLNTTDEKVIDCFADTLKNLIVNEKMVADSLIQIEKRAHLRANVKDVKMLISEINKIQFTMDRPKVTNDSFEAPAINFITLD